MTNWLSAGAAFDAAIASKDEMAIGSIQALKAGGADLPTLVVSGIDAIQDTLVAMQAGELDVTVFQTNAKNGHAASISGKIPFEGRRAMLKPMRVRVRGDE